MKMNKLNVCFLLLLIINFISCGNNKDQKELTVKKSDQTDNSVKSELKEKDKDKSETEIDSDNSDGQSQGSNNSKTNITSREVKAHIGDSLTIKGFVADVYVSEKVTYLNFENKFPKNIFSCAIFSSKAEAFGDLSKYKSKEVEVTGKITTYKNKPQVILNSPDQIKILK